jgi:hypothetical protein
MWQCQLPEGRASVSQTPLSLGSRLDTAWCSRWTLSTVCNISATFLVILMRRVQLMFWPTVSRPMRLGVGHPFGTHDQILVFPFFYRKIALLFVLGRPLWREDGSVIYSAVCQWSESRRTDNHTSLSHLRLLGSLSVASYDSQGLRWKFSYTPPHGVNINEREK